MTEKRKRDSLRKWMTVCVITLLANWLILFYGLAHLLLGIPLSKLWRPNALISVIGLIFAPCQYWAIGDPARDNRKRAIPMAGAFLLAGVAVYVHYGGEVGLWEAGATVPVHIITSVQIVLGCLLGYHLRGKALAEAAAEEARGNDEQSGKL